MSQLQSEFADACRGGRLEEAKAMLREHGKLALRGDSRGLLVMACARCDHETVLWLVENLGLTAEDVRFTQPSVLGWACDQPRLATTRWLAEHFNLTATSVSASESAEELRRVCFEENLETAQWIAGRFGLTRESVTDRDLLREVLLAGGLNAAQWLVERFELTKDNILDAIAVRLYDVCASNMKAARWAVETVDTDAQHPALCRALCRALYRACARGELAIARWLAERSGPPDEGSINGAFRDACENGHLAMARWMVSTFEFIEMAMRTNNSDKLRNLFIFVCSDGRLEFVWWLTERFKLTVEDVRAYNDSAIRHAYSEGYLVTVQWIVDTFGITDARFESPSTAE